MLAKHLFILLVLFSTCAHAAGNSGLPLPRFVSLKSEEVNVRTGPGTRYPIQWVYRRDGMPVEVIEEYDLWRKVRDIEGASGWVHKSMLDGKRTVIIKAKEARVVRAAPEPSAYPVLKVEPKVIARIVECEKGWCRVQVAGRKGWIERQYLWGVYADETLE